jgi:hypothetical protein
MISGSMSSLACLVFLRIWHCSKPLEDYPMKELNSDLKRSLVNPLIPAIAGLLLISIACGWSNASDNQVSSPSRLISASLAGEYRDYSVDIDGDGLFDLMAIDIGVDVLLPGEYTLSGYLFDSNDREVAWSIDHEILQAGHNQMRFEFECKTMRQYGSSGNFTLRNLILSYGNSETGMSICDQLKNAFKTSCYDFSQSAAAPPNEKIVSGSGEGEILLTVFIKRTLPVTLGKYSLDISGIHIPPISSPFNVTFDRKYKSGYAYTVEGAYLPEKPNNFTVSANQVENLNIGLKKIQGKYKNSSTVWQGMRTRIWISQQVEADPNGLATATSDLISPGAYDARIFGDAAPNATQINLTMSLVKKILINGRFHLIINTTGFPVGNYSISARAVNGTLKIDEIAVDGLAIAGQAA